MRKSKNSRIIILIFASLLSMILMSGCVSEIMDNTSQKLNLYKSTNEYGLNIVVNREGERQTGFSIDQYGNICEFYSNSPVILNKNTGTYIKEPKMLTEETALDEKISISNEIPEVEISYPSYQPLEEIQNKVEIIQNAQYEQHVEPYYFEQMCTEMINTVPIDQEELYYQEIPSVIEDVKEYAVAQTQITSTASTAEVIEQENTVEKSINDEVYIEDNDADKIDQETPAPVDTQERIIEPIQFNEQPQETPKVVHEHSWETKILKEPTCTEHGIIDKSCNCGLKEEEIIQPKGHSFEYAVKEDRTTYLRCSVCGFFCTEHSYELIDEIIPTCEDGGYKRYRCSVCGDALKENLNPQHTYDNTGTCIYCGYVDGDIYTAHGRYLATTALSEYEKMMDIVNFVYQNCHGDCIQCSYAAKSAAQQCGLTAYYVHVNGIDCPVLNVPHYKSDLFGESGYCRGCGMGNNHHWIRFDLKDGTWYEFDIQGLGTYCAGPNTEVHKAYFGKLYA